MKNTPKAIALEARLRDCKHVRTLGVRPNFSGYGPEERELIRNAEKIYYPSTFYADLFDTMGKQTFPSYHTYKCVQDKIKQTALFELLGIPHPRTKVFYGNRQKNAICDNFQFPFIGKIPRGSAMGRGVFLIHDRSELQAFCLQSKTAYIQEYLPVDRDIRCVVIGKKIVHAYWRIASESDFRCNVACGGRICLDPVPDEALELALHTARACHWDDVGMDVGFHDGRFFVFEANMKYGKEGFRRAGINYAALMDALIENGEI